MFDPYPKINSVWKRDEKGKVIVGDYSTPEIEYLADLPWTWTEKVDGTNIRLGWEHNLVSGSEFANVFGRSNNAQIPPKLLVELVQVLQKIHEPMRDLFPDTDTKVTLYGEGYGSGIQKGGGNYRDTPGFVLFDVVVHATNGHDWWLHRADVDQIADEIGVDAVPTVAVTSLTDAVEIVAGGFVSRWDGVDPEGLVGRPVPMLRDRRGGLIQTKIKGRDFA